jgi:hypothetical protein
MNNTVVDQRDEWTGYGMDYATSHGFFDRRYLVYEECSGDPEWPAWILRTTHSWRMAVSG